MYTYKMVQVPPNISVEVQNHTGNVAAAYLQTIVNKYAKEGWEFQRVDEIGVQVNPGCFDSLFGKKTEVYSYYVVTFRKNVSEFLGDVNNEKNPKPGNEFLEDNANDVDAEVTPFISKDGKTWTCKCGAINKLDLNKKIQNCSNCRANRDFVLGRGQYES